MGLRWSSTCAPLPLVKARPLGRRPPVGARVACRTAADTGADAVLCLAFPLEPPRPQGRPPSASRRPELDAVTVPTLVVQGQRDRFGIPPEGPLRSVAVVRGDHALRSDQGAVGEAVRAWLSRLLGDAV